MAVAFRGWLSETLSKARRLTSEPKAGRHALHIGLARPFGDIMPRTRNCLPMVLAFTALSACGSNSAAPPKAPDAQSDTTSASANGLGQATLAVSNYPAVTAQLLAAAEPFESLTETAFSATPPARSKAIDAAENAAKGIAGIVPHAISVKLADELTSIRRANAADRPADVALASMECFRTLVSAVPGTPAIPVDVSLLDYAGFRYDADAQAAPVRWADMARAMIFARERWSNIRMRPAAAGLVTRFETVLTDMEKAVSAQNVPHARASAKAELDMVDELESVFQHVDSSKS